MPMNKSATLAVWFAALSFNAAMAAETPSAHDHQAEHGGQIFHAFRLETDYGAGRHDPVARWDFDGWIGGDANKLHLKSEGETVDGKTDAAEFWAMYSRTVAPFWDAQLGIRQDTQPAPATYLVVGLEGLAPYFFETEAHFFISDEGDVSARIHLENDFLVTQRLILQPYGEATFYAQDVADQEVGAGLAHAELGLQTRYEITRNVAPYLDIRYERAFGETSSIARKNGEENDDFIASVGLRWMF